MRQVSTDSIIKYNADSYKTIKIDDPDEEVISLLSCEMKKSIELESQTDVTSFSLDYRF